MKIKQLTNLLSMFPDHMDVMVQSSPDDLCSSLEIKHIFPTEAHYEEKYKSLEPAMLVITGYIPHDHERNK